MADDAEEPGFLSRWSRRKVQVRQGQVVEPAGPAAASVPSQTVAAATTTTATTTAVSLVDINSVSVQPGVATADAAAAPPSESQGQADAEAEAQTQPTLADVATLTRESDYSRFVARSVQPDVKNAALAKLFTDPHFNVMDGLDVYIDDYGKPDPLPPSMLRQMLQAHVLGLFDDEKDPANVPPSVGTAQQASAQPLQPEQPEPPVDENTDLQLQPDDAAGRGSPEPGAGEDARRAH